MELTSFVLDWRAGSIRTSQKRCPSEKERRLNIVYNPEENRLKSYTHTQQKKRIKKKS